MQFPSLGGDGGRHDNAVEYSCLENPRDRGASSAAVHRVAELDTTEMTYTNYNCTLHLLLLPLRPFKILEWGSVNFLISRVLTGFAALVLICVFLPYVITCFHELV